MQRPESRQRTQHLELFLHRSGKLDERRQCKAEDEDEDEDEDEELIAAIKQRGQVECKRTLLLCTVVFPLISIIIFLLGLLLASRQ